MESKSVSPDERESIDLQPFIDKGLLITADLEFDEEREALVEFTAQRLDDGEAATMAIATHRNWAVATDDRAARRVLNNQHQQIQIISTPEIMKHWQDNGKPEADAFQQAIVAVEKRANYLPGRRDPLYEWWQSCKRA